VGTDEMTNRSPVAERTADASSDLDKKLNNQTREVQEK
jgi:hypothetical protein